MIIVDLQNVVSIIDIPVTRDAIFSLDVVYVGLPVIIIFFKVSTKIFKTRVGTTIVDQKKY